MNDQITVFINGEEKSYMDGTSYLAAAKEYQKQYAHDIVLATVDGKLKELNKRMANGERITFVTVADPMGFSSEGDPSGGRRGAGGPRLDPFCGQ